MLDTIHWIVTWIGYTNDTTHIITRHPATPHKQGIVQVFESRELHSRFSISSILPHEWGTKRVFGKKEPKTLEFIGSFFGATGGI